jgi:hypothetical protein
MKDYLDQLKDLKVNFEQILQVLIDYIEEMNHLTRQISTKMIFDDELYHIDQMERFENEY